MSGNPEDHKEPQKLLPLDLARTQMTAVRTVESSKAPLVMTSQALRNVRVLTQGGSASNSPISMGPTIITNLMPGAVIKQGKRWCGLNSFPRIPSLGSGNPNHFPCGAFGILHTCMHE